MAGKYSSWLPFGLKYLVPSWIFRKDRIVDVSGGVDSLVLVGWQRDRGKTWSSSAAVRDFAVCPSGRAYRCRTVSSSANWKLLSYRFRLQSSNTPAMMPVFLRSVVNALILNFELVKAGSEITGNGFLSGSERRNCSMAAPKGISVTNFGKLTVCHHSSSQTCKSSSEKYSVLLLTFLRSVSKICSH